MPEPSQYQPTPTDRQRALAVVAHPDDPTHAVEISGEFERFVGSSAAHRQYLAAPGGDMADPATFRRRGAADRPGAWPATAFELVEL